MSIVKRPSIKTESYPEKILIKLCGKHIIPRYEIFVNEQMKKDGMGNRLYIIG